jgi:hypothetical protein
MNFTINCKIIEVAKRKDASKVSVRVLVGNTEELMCMAPSSQYDLLSQNKGEWVKLVIRPSSTITKVSYTETKHINRFNITEITPHKTTSRFPRMEF